jgi:hypothetical protein
VAVLVFVVNLLYGLLKPQRPLGARPPPHPTPPPHPPHHPWPLALGPGPWLVGPERSGAPPGKPVIAPQLIAIPDPARSRVVQRMCLLHSRAC